MSILDQLHDASVTDPPRTVIVGWPGIGKTTLASRWQPPVVVAQTEYGTPVGVSFATLGQIKSYATLLDLIKALGEDQHDFNSFCLDTVDAAEPLIWDAVCKANNWPSIETPGYGRGFVEADKVWRDFLAALDWLRRTRSMNIVLLAHSNVETVNDPRVPSYSSYQLRLHRRARALVQDWADAIFFLSTDLHIVSEDQGFNRMRNRADGGATRWLHTEGRPAFVAKNRYGLPAKIRVGLDFDVMKELAPMFPSVANNGAN